MMQMAKHDELNMNTNNGKLGSQSSLKDSDRPSSGTERPGSQTNRPGSQQSVKAGSRRGSKASLNGDRPGSKTSVNGQRPGSKTSVSGDRPGSKTSVSGQRPGSKTSVNGQRPGSKTGRPASQTSDGRDSKQENGEVTKDTPNDEQHATEQPNQEHGKEIPNQEASNEEQPQEQQQAQEQQPKEQQQQQPQEQQPQEKQQQQPQEQQPQEEQQKQPEEQEQQEAKTGEAEQNQEEKEPTEELSPLQIKLKTLIGNYKAKSLPKEDVVKTAEGLIEVLQELELWDNDTALQALKKMSRVYFDYRSCRQTVGKRMVEMGFPETCLKMYRKFNNLGVFSSDSIWFPTYYILNNFWNFTDASAELSLEMARVGFISILTANVTHKPYLENQTSKNVKYVLKSSLSTLQNIVHTDGVRQYYEENNVVDALKPFLVGEQDMFLKILTIMTLSVLVTEDENAKMEDSGTIPFIVKHIGKALANSKGRSSGFTSMELTDTLGRIAVNDENKKKIVNAGALPHLVQMIQSKKEEKQYSGARCLWTLCFDPECKQQIKEEPGCVEALEELKKSENSGVQKQANGTLWKLEEDQNKKNAQEVGKDIEGHIMISYNWGNKDMVLQIKERLQAEGYKVWVDVEQMGGSTLEAMALAVENACLVLVCLSEKYKLSPNCRTEAEYTFQLKKPLVPLMMQRYYKPDGWLGMLCGAKMYVNFDGKYDFDYAFNMLKRELTNTLAPPSDEVDQGAQQLVQRMSTVNTYAAAPAPAPALTTAPAPTATFRKWNTQEVEAWVKDNELTGFTADLLEGMNGKKLYQLCQMKAQAPEFFFNYLSSKENLELNDMLQLTDAMEQLE